MATTFEVTALKGVNRVGDIKRLDNNYLQVILGALEFDNSVGAVYDKQRVERILAANSIFQRRINAGYLRGEWGHPKEYDYPNMRAFIQRIHSIDERNWAFHIRKVWIVDNYRLPNGRVICAIMGEICPTGKNNEAFERILANPDENLAFSIRSMATDRVVGGQIRKYIDNIITWDLVNEPGLSCANKFYSPSCESAMELPVSIEMLEAALMNSRSQVSVESSIRESIEAIRAMNRNKLSSGIKPLITSW